MLRRAKLSDAVRLAALSKQLGYEVEEQAMIDRLTKILNDDDHAVFVMELDNGAAGWVHVHGRLLLESRPFAEIGGLVVDSGRRRQKIGENLMKACEEWARDRGYADIRVRSSSQRTEAHQFYEKIGYDRIKSQQVFNRRIEN